MMIIEIQEDCFQELSENVGKMLRYGGKVMECVEKMERSSQGEMNERRGRGGWRDSEGQGGGYHLGRGGYRMRPMYPREGFRGEWEDGDNRYY